MPSLEREAVRQVSPLEEVIPALTDQAVVGTSTERKTICPWHDDHAPSLRVNVDKQVWRCDPCGIGGDVFAFVERHRACSFPDAVQFLGDRVGLAHKKPSGESGTTFRSSKARTKAAKSSGHATVAAFHRFEVRGVSGQLEAIHERVEQPGRAKTFIWRQPDGTTGLGGRKVQDLPLYNSHLLSGWPASEPIVVAEGAGVADSLQRRGVPAVATVTGAGSTPSDDVLRVLDGRRVILWPDNDDRGRQHMTGIADRLVAIGVTDVRIVVWPDAPAKGDAVDFAGDLTALLGQAVPYRQTSRPVTANTSVAFPLTEVGDAEHFASREAGRFAFDHARRRWLTFEGHHWRIDATGKVVQAAIEAIRDRQAAALRLADDAARKRGVQWTLAGESDARIRHMLAIAGSHPALRIEGTEWDQNPWLLGVANGVVDLKTGSLRPGQPDDFLTRVTAVPYEPEAVSPRWDRFVPEICNDDGDLAGFLHRSIGYALTGETGEQVFWIYYGLGGNGKSTFLEVITRYVMPDHSWTMSFPTAEWAESMSEYQRAELVGQRIVIAKESEESKRLNTEFVKSLTGGDTVNARHPYGRPFTFIPAAKFILACNHRPIIRDDSHGMWRRVRLVPFGRTFAGDPSLLEALRAEAPGILAWAVRGCLAWQERGLDAPDAVTVATQDYRQDSDTLASFVAACCLEGAGFQVRGKAFYEAYEAWCQEQRIPDHERLSQRATGERMKRLYQAVAGRQVTYVGVGLRQDGGA